MVAMAGLQVFIVRFFFQGARKGTLIPFMVRDIVNAAYRLCMIETHNPTAFLHFWALDFYNSMTCLHEFIFTIRNARVPKNFAGDLRSTFMI